MKGLRFSIASVLLAILLVAVAVAALRAASDRWDGALLGSTLLILQSAILLTIHRTERRRAYWLGFALFGWAYLIVSLIPPLESRLPTTKGLAYVGTTWIWPPPAGLAYFDYDSDGTLDLVVAGASSLKPPYLISTSGTRENFVFIGHSLLTLLSGFIGGRLSRGMYDKDHLGIERGGDHPTDDRRRP
jgi:hypothetical protein